MSLLRTNLAIEDCEKHLKDSNAVGTAIESYLTQHISVVMCAEMQQEIYRLIDEKTRILPEDIKAFVSVAGERLLRSVKTGDIAGFLGLFGSAVKDSFNENVDEHDVTTYNYAVSGRHKVAHAYGLQITFNELKQATESALRILEAVEFALSV